MVESKVCSLACETADPMASNSVASSDNSLVYSKERLTADPMVLMWAALSAVLMDDCSGGYSACYLADSSEYPLGALMGMMMAVRSVEMTVFQTADQWAEPTVDLKALRTEPRTESDSDDLMVEPMVQRLVALTGSLTVVSMVARKEMMMVAKTVVRSGMRKGLR